MTIFPSWGSFWKTEQNMSLKITTLPFQVSLKDLSHYEVLLLKLIPQVFLTNTALKREETSSMCMQEKLLLQNSIFQYEV